MELADSKQHKTEEIQNHYVSNTTTISSTTSLNKNSSLDNSLSNNSNSNSNNNNNSTPTKQLLIAELDSSTTNHITKSTKKSELRLSELYSSDISTDSSNSSSLFASLPVSTFSSLKHQQQLHQRSLNRRSFDPASISSLNLINSGATTPPSKLARTLSSLVILSNKKKDYGRHTFPGGFSPSSSSTNKGNAIPLDITSLINSASNNQPQNQPTTPININQQQQQNKQQRNSNSSQQLNTPPSNNSSNDNSIDQISPHFTRRPSSLIVGAFPMMTPQSNTDEYQSNGRTTPDEEISEQHRFYQKMTENPDGYITIDEIRSILSCYDHDAIDQIISGIPFQNGICLNRDFLGLVQEFQNSQYDDDEDVFIEDDYDDTRNHPINNLMDFKVDENNKLTIDQFESSNSSSSVNSDRIQNSGFVQKPRRFDLSIPPSHGEFIDNGSVNGAGITSREYLELQSELSRLRNEVNSKELEVRKRMKMEEDMQILQTEITSKEEENLRLKKENTTLKGIDKKHKDISDELEKTKERENKSKKEIEILKKKVQKNDEDMKKMIKEQEVLERKEEDALKAIETKETEVKRSKREYGKLEKLFKELNDNFQLQSQVILQMKQKEEELVQQQQLLQQQYQQNAIIDNSHLLVSVDGRSNLKQSQLHDQKKFQQNEDQINELKSKIDSLEIERSTIQDQNQQLLQKLKDQQSNQQSNHQAAIDEITQKYSSLQSLLSENRLSCIEQINNSQQYVSQMIGSIEHLSQSLINSSNENEQQVDQVIQLLSCKLPNIPDELLLSQNQEKQEQQQYKTATEKLDASTKQLNDKWKALYYSLVQWKKSKQRETLQQRQEMEESKNIIKQLLTKQSETEEELNNAIAAAATKNNNNDNDSAIVYEKPPGSWYGNGKHFLALLGLVIVIYLFLTLLITSTIPPQPLRNLS